MSPRTFASLSLVVLLACDKGYTDDSRRFADPVDDSQSYPTVVHEPTAFGVLDTPIVDPEKGTEFPAGTACETCHGPTPEIVADEEITVAPDHDFHDNIELEHGQLTCYQCHDPRNRTQLHLADGSAVPFVEVMRLCAQCHGPQYRDYSHQAHGGMSGSWDVRQGPRIRNNCVDCHTPHSPAIKQVIPTLPPRDRHLRGEE